YNIYICVFFFQAEDGIRYRNVTGVQTCALPILTHDDSIVLTPLNQLNTATKLGVLVPRWSQRLSPKLDADGRRPLGHWTLGNYEIIVDSTCAGSSCGGVDLCVPFNFLA